MAHNAIDDSPQIDLMTGWSYRTARRPYRPDRGNPCRGHAVPSIWKWNYSLSPATTSVSVSAALASSSRVAARIDVATETEVIRMISDATWQSEGVMGWASLARNAINDSQKIDLTVGVGLAEQRPQLGAQGVVAFAQS